MKTPRFAFMVSVFCAAALAVGITTAAHADQADKQQIESILKKVPSQSGTVWQRIRSTSCEMNIDWSASWVGKMPDGGTQVQIIFGLPVNNPILQSGLSASWKIDAKGKITPLNGWADHLMNEPNNNYGC